MSESSCIEVAHDRVGTIRVSESAVIRLPGLPGFPEARRFALVAHDDGSPFCWLACLDDPELAFVVTDPRLFFPDYAPALPQGVLEALGAGASDEVELQVIVNLGGSEPMLNLAAPLVVHVASRQALQVVLDDGSLPIAAPLPKPKPEAPGASADAGPAVVAPSPAETASTQIESKPQT